MTCSETAAKLHAIAGILEGIQVELEEEGHTDYIEKVMEIIASTQPALSTMISEVHANAHYLPEYELGLTSTFDAFAMHQARTITPEEVTRYRKYTRNLLDREYRPKYLETLNLTPDEPKSFDRNDFHPEVMFLNGYHPTAYYMWYVTHIAPSNQKFVAYITEQSRLFTEDLSPRATAESTNSLYRGMLDVLVPTTVALSGESIEQYFKKTVQEKEPTPNT